MTPEAVLEYTKANGGGTFLVRKGVPAPVVRKYPYLAVSLRGGVVLPARTPLQQAADTIRLFLVARNADLTRPLHRLGTWYNPETRELCIDVTRTFPYFYPQERRDAMRRALALGTAEGQKAIYDSGTSETIPVAADGLPPEKEVPML